MKTHNPNPGDVPLKARAMQNANCTYVKLASAWNRQLICSAAMKGV